jgi:putative flippase GtrA
MQGNLSMGTQDRIGSLPSPEHSAVEGKNGVMTLLTDKKERGRFLRFAVVGSIGAIIDLTIFNFLSGPFGMPALTAQAISFSVAVISNFLWNRFWTYPDSREKPLAGQLGQFVVVSVIGGTLRTFIFDWLENGLIWLAGQVVGSSFFLSPRTIGHNVALATVIIVIMFWNFFVNRYWTYNDVK